MSLTHLFEQLAKSAKNTVNPSEVFSSQEVRRMISAMGWTYSANSLSSNVSVLLLFPMAPKERQLIEFMREQKMWPTAAQELDALLENWSQWKAPLATSTIPQGTAFGQNFIRLHPTPDGHYLTQTGAFQAHYNAQGPKYPDSDVVQYLLPVLTPQKLALGENELHYQSQGYWSALEIHRQKKKDGQESVSPGLIDPSTLLMGLRMCSTNTDELVWLWGQQGVLARARVMHLSTKMSPEEFHAISKKHMANLPGFFQLIVDPSTPVKNTLSVLNIIEHEYYSRAFDISEQSKNDRNSSPRVHGWRLLESDLLHSWQAPCAALLINESLKLGLSSKETSLHEKIGSQIERANFLVANWSGALINMAPDAPVSHYMKTQLKNTSVVHLLGVEDNFGLCVRSVAPSAQNSYGARQETTNLMWLITEQQVEGWAKIKAQILKETKKLNTSFWEDFEQALSAQSSINFLKGNVSSGGSKVLPEYGKFGVSLMSECAALDVAQTSKDVHWEGLFGPYLVGRESVNGVLHTAPNSLKLDASLLTLYGLFYCAFVLRPLAVENSQLWNVSVESLPVPNAPTNTTDRFYTNKEGLKSRAQILLQKLGSEQDKAPGQTIVKEQEREKIAELTFVQFLHAGWFDLAQTLVEKSVINQEKASDRMLVSAFSVLKTLKTDTRYGGQTAGQDQVYALIEKMNNLGYMDRFLERGNFTPSNMELVMSGLSLYAHKNQAAKAWKEQLAIYYEMFKKGLHPKPKEDPNDPKLSSSELKKPAKLRL